MMQKPQKIGFVGGGRVTRIMLGGWRQTQQMPHEVVVCDSDESVLARIQDEHPNVIVAGNEISRAAAQDVLFLAVHPPQLIEIAGQVKSSLQPSAVFVSLAPKWTIAKLAETLGGFQRLARLIPNAPSIVAKGFNPIAFSEALTDGDRAGLTSLLSPLGQLPTVPEEHLEIYAILTAMGPTYFWPQLYELKRLAVSYGLSDDRALTALLAMVEGCSATMAECGDAEQVQDLIPVKPLAEIQPVIAEAFRTKLDAMLQKIRPVS